MKGRKEINFNAHYILFCFFLFVLKAVKEQNKKRVVNVHSVLNLLIKKKLKEPKISRVQKSTKNHQKLKVKSKSNSENLE